MEFSREISKREDIRPGLTVVLVKDQDPRADHVRSGPKTKDNSFKYNGFLTTRETEAIILEKPERWELVYPFENEGFLWVFVHVCRAHVQPPGQPGHLELHEADGWMAVGEIDGGDVKKWYVQSETKHTNRL